MPDEKRPLKLWEYETKCPICGEKLVVSEYLYDVPLYGKTLLVVGTCNNCGYRVRHVMHLEQKDAIRIVFKIENPDDVKALVIRGPNGRIIIPELEISLDPGPGSQGYITTIEGVLEDLHNYTNLACEEEPGPRCDEIKEALAMAKRGERPLTVIIEDPEGLSDIISDKTKREKHRF